MASYLRPRRGKLATAKAQLTASAPLKRGEVFFEVPDTGVGTGYGKIKMGDGSTAYESLPYFLSQTTVDYDNAVIGWTNTTAADSSPYSTNAGYITNIVPTANLKTILTNLKKLLLNFNSQITALNNDMVSHTKDTAVGSATSPVYVASDGTATVCTLGAAATKGTTTSVTSGSADLVTSGGVYSKLGTQCTYSLSGTTLTITSK